MHLTFCTVALTERHSLDSCHGQGFPSSLSGMVSTASYPNDIGGSVHSSEECRCETDHSPLSTAEVNTWSCVSTVAHFVIGHF